MNQVNCCGYGNWGIVPSLPLGMESELGMELETKWHLVNNESLQGLGCNPSQLTYTPLEQYPLPNS